MRESGGSKALEVSGASALVPLPDANAVAAPDIGQHVQEFEARLLAILAQFGLPTDGVFGPVQQRRSALRNLDDVLAGRDDTRRGEAIYVSKFAAAVANGLLDAALNYL